MKNKGRKPIIVLVILALIVLGVFLIALKQQSGIKELTYDFYLSKYAPLSPGFSDCKKNGLQPGGVCEKCESFYKEALGLISNGELKTDNEVLEYVKQKSQACVNNLNNLQGQ